MERLQPALKRLTWESLNIDSFISHVRQGLDQLDDRVFKINQISETVLEFNLRRMSCLVLVHLPDDQSFSLSRFVQLQEESIQKGFVLLNEKSVEMEQALTELIQENRTQADVTHVHSKSDMLQEVALFFCRIVCLRCITSRCRNERLNSMKWSVTSSLSMKGNAAVLCLHA